MTWNRLALATMLVAATILLPPLACASPPDPTWIRGFWDDDDFDSVVVAITSATGAPTPAFTDAPPPLILLDVIADIKALAERGDLPLEHAPRSPPVSR
jgi:hypothetical protein